MVRACAFDRPKIFKVASPLTTSRKCPESSCRVRSWRSVWARVAIPIRAMKTGINGQRHRHDDGRDPVALDHGDQDGQRDDHRQEQLREVAGEVPVQGVDAAGRPEPARSPRPLDRSPVRSEAGRPARTRAARSLDLTRAEQRLAATSERPDHQGRSATTPSRSPIGTSQLGQVLPADEGARR